MSRFFICCLFLVSLSIDAKTQHTILIKNVTIIDVEHSTLLKNQFVLIKDSIIINISTRINKINGQADTTVDATGKYLIPGLWDMHTHIWNDATTFPLLLANGITGVRGMFDVMSNVNQWREKIQAGKLDGPHFFAAGPIVDGPKPIWPGSVAVSTEAGARKAVDSLKNILKVDFIKVYSLLSKKNFMAIADESKKQHIPFSGHVPNEVSILEAAVAGQKSMEHLYGFIESASDSADYWFKYQRGEIKDSNFTIRANRKEFLFRTYNENKLKTILTQVKKTGAWVCPTLTVNRGIAYINDTTLLNDPRMDYMGTFMRNFWDYRKDFRFKSWTENDFKQSKQEFELKLKITKLIHEAGIPLIAGTDFPNPHCYIGFGLHEELEWLVKAGLSNGEALKTATINPAKFFNLSNIQGSVTVNKIADLVLLSKNPLENISHTKTIEMVFSKGKMFSSKQLQLLLEGIKKSVAVNNPVISTMGFDIE